MTAPPRVGHGVTGDQFLRLPAGTLLRGDADGGTDHREYRVQYDRATVDDLRDLTEPGIERSRGDLSVHALATFVVLALPVGECGECMGDFNYESLVWVDGAPAMTCRVHDALAPGWVYMFDDPGLADPGTIYVTPDGAVYRLTEYIDHPEPSQRGVVVALYDVLRPGRGMGAVDALPVDAREVWRP